MRSTPPNHARRAHQLLLCAMVVSAAPLGAQDRYDTPTARVEVLGLATWTRRMLEDSIQRFAPGRKHHDAACMATLRYDLKFPDALVVRYRGFRQGKDFVSIRVIEPTGRRAAHWRALPVNARASLIPAYAPLIVPVTDSTGSTRLERLTSVVENRDSTERARTLAFLDSTALLDDARASEFLRA